jgi:hypothetical protein
MPRSRSARTRRRQTTGRDAKEPLQAHIPGTDGFESFQQLYGRSEMARIEDIVVGLEQQKFRLRYCDKTVEIFDRTDIAFGAHVVDPFIAEGVHDVRCVVLGCVVAYDQTEGRERLCEDAFDTFVEPPGPIEGGDTHRDLRGASGHRNAIRTSTSVTLVSGHHREDRRSSLGCPFGHRPAPAHAQQRCQDRPSSVSDGPALVTMR